MNEITSVQIPKEIDNDFEALAIETRIPKKFHLEKALKNYLKQFNESSSKSIRFDDESVPDLAKIDVTVNAKHIFQARLRKAKAENERKMSLNSPFFSSSPVDLGYTDPSVLDKIIAGDD